MYTPLGSWYHATKYALEGWSDCLRLELAPLGIQVVVVEPDLIATEFGDVTIGPLLQRSGKVGREVFDSIEDPIQFSVQRLTRSPSAFNEGLRGRR